MAEHIAYNCTVIGQRYLEKQAPCEDSSISYHDENVRIAIVADGHGDRACFRSYAGSRAACEAALEKMLEFARAVQEDHKEELLFTPKGAHKLTTNLFEAILCQWQDRVLTQLRENPPTQEEYAGTGEENAAVYRRGEQLEHIFGTTLIAMLMTDRYLLVLHQGDGRCLVFHENGTVDQPVPWDPRCEGRNTTSLCDPDVLTAWRYHVIDLKKDRVIACYAISDGIEDSFETLEEVNAYVGVHAADYAEKGRQAYLEQLPAHFATVTKNGSRDDISIGGILDPEAVAVHGPRYRLQHAYFVHRTAETRATDRLSSMHRKTQYLTQQLQDAQSAWNLTGTQDAAAALEAARAEYDSYMALRREFEEKADTARQAAMQVQQKLQALCDAVAEKEEPEEPPVYTQPPDDYVGFDEPEETPKPPVEPPKAPPQEPPQAAEAAPEPVIEIQSPPTPVVGAPLPPVAQPARKGFFAKMKDMIFRKDT